MSHDLTAGQRALLAADLETRRRTLRAQLTQHHEGGSRVEHARELLEQDADDAPQRAGDREVDQALSDLELRELDAIDRALARVHDDPAFGSCSACGQPIPFDRLRIEPYALRCVPCEALQERRH